jgi:hypothetical protein
VVKPKKTSARPPDSFPFPDPDFETTSNSPPLLILPLSPLPSPIRSFSTTTAA